MKASAHAPFVRLSRLLGCAAVLVSGRRSGFAKDVELLVLRHQLAFTTPATPSAVVMLSSTAVGGRLAAPTVICLLALADER
jgi:hypothetical protein